MSNFETFSRANLHRDLFAISLDASLKMSLQAQLLDTLRRIVSKSPHLVGARLPASRTLASELSISRTTVQAVYDQMISEGYLVTRQGSGTFIASEITHLSQPQPIPRPAGPTTAQWRPFQTGLPDQTLLPHRQWARHLERAWRNPAPALLTRPDPLGWYPLREAISDHLTAWRHLPCDPGQVVITSGAREAFEVIFHGLLGGGKQVAVETVLAQTAHDPCRHGQQRPTRPYRSGRAGRGQDSAGHTCHDRHPFAALSHGGEPAPVPSGCPAGLGAANRCGGDRRRL